LSLKISKIWGLYLCFAHHPRGQRSPWLRGHNERQQIQVPFLFASVARYTFRVTGFAGWNRPQIAVLFPGKMSIKKRFLTNHAYPDISMT
jgi:hypothetical protein